MQREWAVRIWPLVFAIATAAILGFCSGYYFINSEKVSDPAIAAIGISWAVIPMAMRFWAKHLASQGKLPGTGAANS
jgi:hypothetical protein